MVLRPPACLRLPLAAAAAAALEVAVSSGARGRDSLEPMPQVGSCSTRPALLLGGGWSRPRCCCNCLPLPSAAAAAAAARGGRRRRRAAEAAAPTTSRWCARDPVSRRFVGCGGPPGCPPAAAACADWLADSTLRVSAFLLAPVLGSGARCGGRGRVRGGCGRPVGVGCGCWRAFQKSARDTPLLVCRLWGFLLVAQRWLALPAGWLAGRLAGRSTPKLPGCPPLGSGGSQGTSKGRLAG